VTPFAPAHPCTWPGCGQLVKEGSRCERHKRQERKQYDAGRGSATQRGYGGRWREARARFLALHPTCECGQVATEVDHRVAHRGNYDLFWDESLWSAKCKRCHSRKTAKQDGRWGR